MSDSTPRLRIPELVSMQEANCATWNEALVQLDAFVDLYLLGQYVNAPPASPADGDAYLLGGAPTGAWSGYAYKIASCIDGAWRFYTPFNGLRAYVATSGAFIVYVNGTWTDWNSLISANETSIASAATCDLGAASLFVQITGNTTITSFGTGTNRLRFVRFAQALTLTHNATSLILLGGASRTTAAGDVAIYASDGSGNWRERSYFLAASAPGGGGGTGSLTSGHIFVGNASNVAADVAMSGDATIANTGAVTVAKIDGVAVTIDTDTTLAANSDAKLATQKAVKAYADALIAANDAMVFKSSTDCSSNPNYPAADRGHTYRVSVAGKIDGASGVNVEAGDLFLCLTDGTAAGNQATVGSAWTIAQTNIDGAVIGPASATSGNVATFNGTSGKLLQDGGKALPSGVVVGTSDTQTLSNKTFSGATNFPSGQWTSGGRLGIGVTAPNYNIQLDGPAGATAIQITCGTTTGTSSASGFTFGYDGYDSNLGLTCWNYAAGGFRIGTNNAIGIEITGANRH